MRIARLVIAAAALLPTACTRPAPSDLMPAIQAFLAEADRGYGSPISTEPEAPWAKGPRQTVMFASGVKLVFYIQDGTVTGVYRDGMDGRTRIWPSP